MARLNRSFPGGLAPFLSAVLLFILLSPALAFAAWNGGHDVMGCEQASTTWYFAEGNTRSGFNEWVCLLNPNAAATTATFTYMLGNGENIERTYALPASSRTTIGVNGEVPAENDVSIKVTAPDPIVAERPMYFRFNGTWTGGHDVMGATAPQQAWYFAEGTCRPNFESFLCVQNPSTTDAQVLITYMLGDGQTRVQDLAVTAGSRVTVKVSGVLGSDEDAAHDFSAKVEATNGVGIVAERPMYFNYKGAWTGGHDVVGALSPAASFYFAEGTCRPDFDPFLCVQNPGAATAAVKITYMLGDGATRTQTLDVGKNSRGTVNVKSFLGEGDDAAHDFSCRVETTNGTQVIAERPMYFAYRGRWTGGHAIVGTQQPSSTYYFAEGTCRTGFDPFLCIQNPGAAGADVRITYMLGDGTTREQTLGVGANSRATVAVKSFLGEGDDTAHDFSAKVETTNGTAIVAERPMYFSYLSNATWTLAALGDVNLGGDVSQYLTSNGFDYPWSLIRDIIKPTTLTFANLECTLANSGQALPGKAFTFQGDPAAIPPMRDAGVDVVSQANNHARDYGADSLVDCLGYLDAGGVAKCGAGVDDSSAYAPAFLDANGLRVAFLAYNDIGYDGIGGWQAGPDYPGIADASNTSAIASGVAAAKEQADIVVVSFHWGTERKYTPDERQTDLARLAIDNGADVVLGHHPHVVQGFQFYNGKLIANSLGNFIFNPGSDAGHYTVLTLLDMDASGFRSATVYPYHINDPRPELMGGAEGESWIGQVAGMSQELGTPMTVTNGVGQIP